MNCISLEDISGISNWNDSKVKKMGYLFSGCKKLTDSS